MRASGAGRWRAPRPCTWASGTVRSDGLAQAYFFLLPGSLSPAMIGATLHHAFVMVDAFTGEYLFASEPMSLLLLP